MTENGNPTLDHQRPESKWPYTLTVYVHMQLLRTYISEDDLALAPKTPAATRPAASTPQATNKNSSSSSVCSTSSSDGRKADDESKESESSVSDSD